MEKKVIGLGMSGGVDSSAAAYLLLQNGYFIPITIIITVGMMCITRNHISPHDFATQSMVILKRRADEFTILKSLKQN